MGYVVTQNLRRKKGHVVAEFICRYVVVAILIAAAVPKLLNLGEFEQVIRAYEMLTVSAIPLVALFLPVAEIILAVALICRRTWSKYLTITLLLFFIAVLTTAIYQGLDIDCGCFGPEDPEHKAFQGLRVAIVRDIVMIALLVYSLWYERFLKILLTN